MRLCKSIGCTLLVLALALALPAGAQDKKDDTLTKKKEGRYFLELGEIFLQSDDFNILSGAIDPDGLFGPAGPEDIEVQADTLFQTNPYAAFGFVFPSGKTVVTLSEWQFNDGVGTLTEAAEGEDMTFNLAVPGLTYYRTNWSIPDPITGQITPYDVPNWPEIAKVNLDREWKYFDADIQSNLKQGKKFLLRVNYGARFVSFQERIDAIYDWGEESITLGTPALQYKWHDTERIEANADSKLIGIKGGINARFALGKNQKWAVRGGVNVSILQESTTVQYENLGIELNPFNLNLAALRDPGQTVSGFAWSPDGVIDRENGLLDINIRDTTSDKILPMYDGNVRVEYAPTNYVTIGLGYEIWALQDILSAREIVDKVNENISNLQIDRQNYNDQDPRNNRTVTLYYWDGQPWTGTLGENAIPAEADIQGRRDFTFQGLRFYLRFNF